MESPGRPATRGVRVGRRDPLAQKQEEPVITEGRSILEHRVWDAEAGYYRSYSRSWTKGEFAGFGPFKAPRHRIFCIEPARDEPIRGGVPLEHFYTNACVPIPARRILLSFKRFMPERKKIAECPDGGVSDAVFMSNRDGVHWDRVFGGLDPAGLDRRNWTHRNIMPAWGLLELSPGEYSLYHSEHYQWDDARLRRVTVRKDGFVSLHAGAREGVVVTKPLRFTGNALFVNYSTSAAGSIRVELLNEQGEPAPGYSGASSAEWFGDALDDIVRWPGGKDLSAFQDQPVRLRFHLRDADLYTIRFGQGG